MGSSVKGKSNVLDMISSLFVSRAYADPGMSSPSAGYSSSHSRSGCQASRTTQLPTFDWGRGILKMAAFFGASLPATPSILEKMK